MYYFADVQSLFDGGLCYAACTALYNNLCVSKFVISSMKHMIKHIIKLHAINKK